MHSIIQDLNCVSGGKYLRSQYGETCSEASADAIKTAEKCRSSIDDLKKSFPLIKGFSREEEDSDYPKGCYQQKNHFIYWNKHTTGSPSLHAREICTLQGTVL